MTILSALKETNANDGYLKPSVPDPPQQSYRRLPPRLHRYDAFIIEESKVEEVLARIKLDTCHTPVTFIDINRKRIYCKLVK